LFRRFKRSKLIEYSNYSAVRKWLFVVLILIIIALIWIFYFVSHEYIGIGNSKVSGFIYYKSDPIIAVQVRIGDEEVVTDENGYFVISNLSWGRKTLKINKEHFLPIEKRVFIWKRNIRLRKIEIKRDPAYTAYFSGKVLNNFNKKPIQGAVIYLNNSIQISNEKGCFTFEDVAKGKAEIKISAVGFEDKGEDIILGEEGIEREYYLTPYGKISFTSAREGIKNIYTINYDGTNLKNLTAEYNEDSWGSQFTPNGEKIVFYSKLAQETDQWGQKIAYLYYMDRDGKNLERITKEVIPEGDFVISSDSQRVVFLGRRPGENIPEIYLAGIGTNKEWRQLTNNNIYESGIDISPDGTKVLYSAFHEGMRDIYMVDTRTYKETQITHSKDYEFYPSFSPDGRRILYVRQDYDFSSKIFIYNILTKESSISPIKIENKEKGSIPTSSLEDELIDEGEQIYKTSLDLKNVVWSKDGEKILFASTRDNKTNIFVIDSNGENEVKLTKESADYRNIIWPSIGKILIFIVHRASGDSLAVMDLSTRDIYKIEEVVDDKISWADR